MILAALFAVPILGIQVGQATETKLFTIQKGKILPGSIMLSPDLNHFSYTSNDHKVILDGKAVGPFLSNGAVVYSGDSKNAAFLATVNPNEPSKLYWNGVEKKTDFPVSNVFRAGENGGLCYVERKTETVDDGIDEKGNKKVRQIERSRVVMPDETTDWFRKIDKIGFSDDGSSYYMRMSEEIEVSKDKPVDLTAPTAKDYLVYKGGKKVERDQVMQVFPAPLGEGYAFLTNRNAVIYKQNSTVLHGAFYGKPVFSPTGKQFAFRSEFTGHDTNGVNIPFFHYYINGLEILDLQIQTGLTFDDTGKKWVMCGLNGKNPYIYQSTTGLMSYADAGLGGAPAEPYKVAKFVNGKLVCLFQAKRSKPLIYLEEKGLMDLGNFVAYPDTLSTSPDGKHLIIAGSAGEETHAYVLELDAPTEGIDVLKGNYDLQNLGIGTFVWRNDREVGFTALRKNDLVRVSVRL